MPNPLAQRRIGRMKAEPPAFPHRGPVTEPSVAAWANVSRRPATLLSHKAPADASRRFVPMTKTIRGPNRGRPEGRAHRQRLRGLIVPNLEPGGVVPSGRTVARLLGVSRSEAHRHICRVLA